MTSLSSDRLIYVLCESYVLGVHELTKKSLGLPGDADGVGGKANHL